MDKKVKKIIGKDSPKRIEELDILKALAIICIVAGHSDAPFTHFLCLFHVAVFFTASGFFFKERSSDDLNGLFRGIKSKFKQLWFPFFVWNMIFVLLHNCFIRINIYTDNPDIFNYVSGTYIGTKDYYDLSQMLIRIVKGSAFRTEEGLLGACWFLETLFLVSIGYLVVDFIIKRLFKKHILIIQGIIAILLLAVGFFCSLKGLALFGLARALSSYWLYYIGHVLAVYKDRYINWSALRYGIVLVISFCILLGLNMIGSIVLSANNYENPVYLIATSISGWCFLFSLAHFIGMIPGLKKLMATVGKRTLSVVLFHFLAMKTVAVIIIMYYGLPAFCVSAFPNLYGEKGWWALYTIVGVGLPVLANMIYHLLIDRITTLGSKLKLG